MTLATPLEAKRCSACEQVRPLEAFDRNRSRSDGRGSACKDCCLARRQEGQRERAQRRTPEGKRCPRCVRFLPWGEFHKSCDRADGHQVYCHGCSSVIKREYEERNAEVIALRRAERLARRPPDDGQKTCRKCGETKLLINFYAHRGTADGRANYCDDCQKAATRAWNAAHREEIRERNRHYREADGPATKRRFRQWWLKLYGLSEEQYAALLAEQNGVCAICQKPERYIDARTGEPRRLAVDHDHTTGVVRGLLCGRCNRVIGQMGEDCDSLRRAAEYLAQGNA